MKNTPAKKINNKKTRMNVRPVTSRPTARVEKTKSCGSSWSVSIYVYWFIILFFIAATFYILGRAHNGQPKTHHFPDHQTQLLFTAKLEPVHFLSDCKLFAHRDFGSDIQLRAK